MNVIAKILRKKVIAYLAIAAMIASLHACIYDDIDQQKCPKMANVAMVISTRAPKYDLEKNPEDVVFTNGNVYDNPVFTGETLYENTELNNKLGKNVHQSADQREEPSAGEGTDEGEGPDPGDRRRHFLPGGLE